MALGTCGRYTAGPRQRYGAGALPGANRAQAPDAISGAGFGEAIPRYFTEEQLRELMARLEDAQLCMRDLREENPAAATRASSPKGRAWLARGTSPYGPPPGRTSPRRRWPL